MKMNLVETKNNDLMRRKEVRAVIEHEGKATPSRPDIISEASKALKAHMENIVVNKIFGVKGIDKSEVKITVYSDKKDIPKALAEKMAKRLKLPKAEEKKEASPTTEKAE